MLIKDAFTITWHPDRAAYTVSIPSYEGGQVVPLDSYLRTVDLVMRLRAALGTTETGDALVEVAHNAHRAERELACRARLDALEAADRRTEDDR